MVAGVAKGLPDGAGQGIGGVGSEKRFRSLRRELDPDAAATLELGGQPAEGGHDRNRVALALRLQ